MYYVECMASYKHLSSGGVQICIRHKLLPKRLWATFDDESQARAYAKQLETLLAQGIVPASLLERSAPRVEIWTVQRCIATYIRENSVPASEIRILDTVRNDACIATIGTGDLNYDWAEAWIKRLKRDDNLAPSTIRHRHGALARCFDWMLRRHPDILAQNPLRLLKRGFAVYTPEDERQLALKGKSAKIDEERNRRLEEGEEGLIRAALAERPEELAFFTLALETAMRMRECYTLDLAQIDLPHRTVRLDRTKNGDRRQVPLSSTAIATLREYAARHADAIAVRDGRLFPYWDGELNDAALVAATRDLSRTFALAFAEAGVKDLHFHDLRHEATCRLYEKTTLSDVLIARITGHRDLRMLKRYASLRGSDLASHLW